MKKKRAIRKSDVLAYLAACDVISALSIEELLVLYYIINPEVPAETEKEKVAKVIAAAGLRLAGRKRSKIKK
jgi:hypothetical protein